MTYKDFWLEIRRQLVHFAGIFVLPLVWVFGREITIGLLATLLGLFVIFSLYVKKYPRSGLGKFTYIFERMDAFPFSGAIMFYVGALAALLIFPLSAALPAIAVLAVADSASTIVGTFWGRHKLPVNRKKSWEGSLAFLVSSAVILSIFVNIPVAITIGFIATFVEMLPRVDDNLTIPIAVGAMVWAATAAALI